MSTVDESLTPYSLNVVSLGGRARVHAGSIRSVDADVDEVEVLADSGQWSVAWPARKST